MFTFRLYRVVVRAAVPHRHTQKIKINNSVQQFFSSVSVISWAICVNGTKIEDDSHVFWIMLFFRWFYSCFEFHTQKKVILMNDLSKDGWESEWNSGQCWVTVEWRCNGIQEKCYFSVKNYVSVRKENGFEVALYRTGKYIVASAWELPGSLKKETRTLLLAETIATTAAD